MPTISPFIRFTQSGLNAGFEPELSNQSSLLDAIFNEFSNGDFVGLEPNQVFKAIQNVISPFNSINNGGNFELIYPKPWANIGGGTQVRVFKIQNNQLIATNPDQYISITLEFVDGILDDSIFVFTEGPISFTNNYDSPVFQIENDAKRALVVRNINGASFLPLEYKLQSGIAVSGLARCSDVQFDSAIGYPTRVSQTYSSAPPRNYLFNGLNRDETYIVSIAARRINELINDLPEQPRQMPSGWTELYSSDTTVGGIIRQEYTWYSSSGFKFKLLARFDSIWLCQRFVTATGSQSDSLLSTYLISLDLPYEPTSGNQLYFGDWYDMEWCNFEGCPTENQIYYSPVKTGDSLQFNILPEQANATGLSEFEIAVLDSEGNYLQTIGTAILPDCKIDVVFTVTVSGSSFASILTDTLSHDTVFSGYDQSGMLIDEFATIPFAETVNTSISDYADSVVAYLNANYPVVADYSLGSNLAFLISFNNLTEAYYSINYQIYTTEFEGPQNASSCSCATQYQASILIPSLDDGCYQLALIVAGETNEILAVSNGIKVDNEECFTQILEFWGEDNSITEGFEYYSGWKQRIRVALNGGGALPVIDESIYRNSDGSYQRPSVNSDLKVNLQTDYIDLPTQKAVFAATRHVFFVLGDQNLFVSGDIETATTQDFTTETTYRDLSQMRFSALIQAYQPDNSVCLGC